MCYSYSKDKNELFMRSEHQVEVFLEREFCRAWSRIGLACAKLGQVRAEALDSLGARFLLSSALLSEGKDAVAAYKKAVSFDPSSPIPRAWHRDLKAPGANVDALASVVRQLHSPDTDLAHVEKESGNTAMRGNELALAVACYTMGLVLVPPEVGKEMQRVSWPCRLRQQCRMVLRRRTSMHCFGQGPQDCVFILTEMRTISEGQCFFPTDPRPSARASVTCQAPLIGSGRLKNWQSAKADAQSWPWIPKLLETPLETPLRAAVEKKSDFVKVGSQIHPNSAFFEGRSEARNRLGTTLLACGQVEQASLRQSDMSLS